MYCRKSTQSLCRWLQAPAEKLSYQHIVTAETHCDTRHKRGNLQTASSDWYQHEQSTYSVSHDTDLCLVWIWELLWNTLLRNSSGQSKILIWWIINIDRGWSRKNTPRARSWWGLVRTMLTWVNVRDIVYQQQHHQPWTGKYRKTWVTLDFVTILNG